MTREEVGNVSCYKNGGEHLYDELTKLDILIQLQVLRFRSLYSPKGNNDEVLPGLCIKDEEVDRVMGKKTKDREEHRIKETIQQVESIREKISMNVENSLEQGIYLPFYHLAHLFQSTLFEMDILLVCLAPELDIKYEKLYAYLQDDVTKKSPTVNLILDLLCFSREERVKARECFFNHSPLLKYHLVQFIESDENQNKPLISRRLKLDDRIANYLLGFNVMDSKLSLLAKFIIPQKDWSELLIEEDIKEGFRRLSGELSNEKAASRNKIIIYLKGAYGTGKKSTAEAFCRELQLPLVIVDSRDLLNTELNFEEILRHLFREALLQPAAIYLEHFDRLMADNDNPKKIYYQNMITRAVEEYSFITFLAGETGWKPPSELKKHFFIEVSLEVPPHPLRKRLWQLALKGGFPLSPGVNIDEIAGKFRFTGGQIRDAAADAQQIVKMRPKNDKEPIIDTITITDLSQSCRVQSNQNLSKLAQKITPHYHWSDIILPPDQLQQFKEMVNYVKYRHVVYNDWGFDQKISLGKGLNILFSGPSGTGKTMAAEILSNELDLDFYKIDLSCVVSKYIGETEKNLAGIFKEAETANAVLFFDEADALFGKRSEVKDAHDRYANIEINYLLQKMEEHEGIIILASNFRKNIDEAFTRRMHFSLEFPFPDEEYRLHIWKKIFPKETPRANDIDYQFLANKFKIPGGNIKNIALSAAFLAADNSRKITMMHLIYATKREYQKMGKLYDQSDFEKYGHHIADEIETGGAHE
jgi:SpoVK/Ycf46/Vps4 family AAA+-type ATPase